MVKIRDTSSYGMVTAQNARRKAIIQQGIARSENMRSYMVANINKTASTQVQTTEMQLRTKSAEAAKARLAALNKLA